MSDTSRSLAAIQALLADNTSQDISAQDLRDAVVSVFGNYAEIYQSGTSFTTLAVGAADEKLVTTMVDGLDSGGCAADAANQKITVTVDGVYLVIMSGLFRCTGTHEEFYSIGISDLTPEIYIQWLTADQNEVRMLSMWALATVTTSKDFYIRSGTSSSEQDLDFSQLRLTVLRIG